MTRASTVFQLPDIFHENIHLFVSAFLFSTIELLVCYYYGVSQDLSRYEYITLFTILLIVSLPFTIVDPPIWFCIFMTSFSHMLFFKGFYSLALLNVTGMFCGLLLKRVYTTDEEEMKPLHPDSTEDKLDIV